MNNFDYLLIDRGVYDHITFTRALYRCEQISKEEYEAQGEYFQKFGFLEDSVIVFMINPDEAMARENKHHRFKGRVMNRDFLSTLHEAYQKIIPEIQQILYC